MVRGKFGLDNDWALAHAWGRDELLPLSNTSSIRWGHLGVTLLDSLDTLLLLGLEEEYAAARYWAVTALPARLRLSFITLLGCHCCLRAAQQLLTVCG